jgi:undecaprenyl-diphosphatase
MTFLESILLGLVQGLTEFLPVSSSGHLAVFQHFLGHLSQSLSFEVAAHVGTVLSVLTVYFKPVRRVLKDLITFLKSGKRTPGAQLAGLVILGSVPAGIFGVGFKSVFEQMFQSLWVIIAGFICTGIILYLTKNLKEEPLGKDFLDFDETLKIRWWQALLIGSAQAVAITPGISRSGSTIASGILVGLDRRTSAMFSFMLAIPAILGAGLLEARELDRLGSQELQMLLLGLVVSFIVGVIGLKLVLGFVRRGRIHYFSYYLWALAAGLIVYQLN